MFSARQLMYTERTAQKDSPNAMPFLTSHEALELTAHFAFAAERIRASAGDFEKRASVCETASRIAFLKASILARDEQSHPIFGQTGRQAMFAIA